MKIVKFMELKDMPRGTVFSEYEPCIVEGLWIKGDTFKFGEEPEMCGFYEQPVLACHYFGDYDNPPGVFDYGWSRHCSHDDGPSQLFAVYEEVDVLRMISLLSTKGVSKEAWEYQDKDG
jgi:hypothetical protein